MSKSPITDEDEKRFGRAGHLALDAAHTPVMAEEAALAADRTGRHVCGCHRFRWRPRDRNCGGKLTTGRLVGMDRDAQALEIARERLKEYKERVTLVHAELLKDRRGGPGLGPAAARRRAGRPGRFEPATRHGGARIFLPLAGPLDMRMDSDERVTADDIVNEWDEGELADLLYQYGEERDSRRIARTIVRARPIRDTKHLATVVAGARTSRGRQRLHPATKTFLALRIAVNRELEALGQFLQTVPATLTPEARVGGHALPLAGRPPREAAISAAGREGVLQVLTRTRAAFRCRGGREPAGAQRQAARLRKNGRTRQWQHDRVSYGKDRSTIPAWCVRRHRIVCARWRACQAQAD